MTNAVGTPELLLTAPTPARWLRTHLTAHVGDHDVPDEERSGAPRWVGLADLLADDSAMLREAHRGLQVDDGAAPTAAAKWLVSWFAGSFADAAGFTLATASAGLCAHPEQVRWRLHPDGWPDRVEVGHPRVVVRTGHPWSGQPRVDSVADDEAVAAAAVAATTRVAGPLVEAGRALARVGRNAMWAEVADDFGLSMLYQSEVPVTPVVPERLLAAVRTPAAPWRSRPELRVGAAHGGPVYLGRRGGCCLACLSTPSPEPDPETLDDRARERLARFPRRPGEPRYCSTCSLRDLADCEERQLFWFEQERAVRRREAP